MIVLMITRYVSPSGDDRWSGTLSEPNAARNDGPLATPRAARDSVRKARGIDVARDPSRRSAGGLRPTMRLVNELRDEA